MKPSTLQSDLSAKLSVKNTAKARNTSFFYLFFLGGGWGRWVHSRGHSTHFLVWVSLRLVSSLCSVLLYGCETCILDHPCLMHGSGEFPSWNWQTHALSTIIPCHHANDEAVRVGLQWPSVASHILIRKLFSSPATEYIFQISILQQHEILEELLRTSVLAHCLCHLHDAPRTVRECHVSLKQDFWNPPCISVPAVTNPWSTSVMLLALHNGGKYGTMHSMEVPGGQSYINTNIV